MLILAFDCSLNGCSAALVKDGSVLAEKSPSSEMTPAEILIPVVNDLLRDAGILWTQVDDIAVTVGPGSFTGIRTGLSAAKGFAIAANCKVFAIGSLEALAFSILDPSNPHSILVINDARRNQVYVQEFDNRGTRSSPVKKCDVGEVQIGHVDKCRLIGTGTKYFPSMGYQDPMCANGIEARYVGLVAQTRFDQGVHPVGSQEIRPQYSRLPDARAGAGRPLVSVRD